MVIYTVGFGSPEGAPIPLRDEQGNVTGHRKDALGNDVLSRLDEATLEGIAEAGSGAYFLAAEDGAMAGLADEIQSFQDELVPKVPPHEFTPSHRDGFMCDSGT